MVLKGALKQAVIEGIIYKSPAEYVPLPRRKEKTQKGSFLIAEQANEVLKLFNGHPLQPLIYVTLYYGLRRSEVLGLKWDAIDFKNDILEIKHTVVKSSIVVAKDRTKTASSRMKYILLPEIKELLFDLKAKQNGNRKLFGKEYIESDYVFTWANGKLLTPQYITKAFQKVLSHNEFPRMRFHDLRHSCASILYDKGWQLKDIQRWLGHSNIATTSDIYSH